MSANQSNSSTSLHILSQIIAICMIGCGQQPTAPKRVNRIDVFAESSSQPIDEYWQLYRLNGSKIGHRHVTEHQLEEGMRRIASVDRLDVRRFGRRSHQVLTQISVENSDGRVVALGFELKTDDSNERFVGHVSNGSLHLKQVVGGNYNKTVSFRDSSSSIFAIERNLRQKPMGENESRLVRVFRPLVNRVSKIQLTSKQVEKIDVNGEPRSLLRIAEQDPNADSLSGLSVHWVDESGTIIKSLDPFQNRVTVRADEQTALASNDFFSMDLGLDTGVPLEQPFNNASQSTQATFKVTLKSLSPEWVFDTGEGQQFSKESENTGTLTITKILPAPQANDTGEAPQDCLDPSDLIDSNHANIKTLANALIGGMDGDRWSAVQVLRRDVLRRLDQNEAGQIFDRASEVLRKSAGDCTEHAVLLAALCRAHRIPARVAIGLVYSTEKKRFLYHMWNEVLIGRRWFPVDATIPGEVGADHIKLRDSSLAGQTAYTILRPVIGVVEQLEIELLDSK